MASKVLYRQTSFVVPEKRNEGINHAILAAPSPRRATDEVMPHFLQAPSALVPSAYEDEDHHEATISNTRPPAVKVGHDFTRIFSPMAKASEPMLFAALPKVLRGCITAQGFEDDESSSHEKATLADVPSKARGMSMANTACLDDQATLVSMRHSPSPSDTDSSTTTSSSRQLISDRSSSQYTWNTSSTEVRADETGTRTEIHETDVFKKPDYTVTRTIIRPVLNPPSLPARICDTAAFSRSTSPIPTREPTPIARHVSSVEGLMNSLSQLHDARGESFEAEVDRIQDQRELEHVGLGRIEVSVTVVTITREFDNPFVGFDGESAIPMTAAHLNVRD